MKKLLSFVVFLLAISALNFCSQPTDKTGEPTDKELSKTTDGGTIAPDTPQNDGAKDGDTVRDTDKTEGDETDKDSTPDRGSSTIDPQKLGLRAVCPGAKGCLKNDGELYAGAAAIPISPEKYEVANFAYFEIEGYCPPPTPDSPFGVRRCGALETLAMYDRKDCGRDGICPGDKIKTKFTCRGKQKCPKGLVCNQSDSRCYIHYPGPDPDGSEKDGLPDWFLDCGTDRICPCIAPDGSPSYYGKDKKCLKGHKKNPKYTGPDSDGSEGNGKFEGIWMGGFSTNHPLQGKHDDIWARALVLKTGDVTVAIVSIDVVGFFYDDIEKVRQKVRQKLSKEDLDYILISSTHTHEAPDVMGQWGPTSKSGIPNKSGVIPRVIKRVIENTAQAIIKAKNSMKKAKIEIGFIRTGVDGLVRDSRDPFIIDDSLYAMKITDLSGKTIATLVNWGNHPETLSDTNNYLSSDFPHYVREGLEKGIPAGKNNPKYDGLGGVAIFLQGAVGCLMTPLGVAVPDLNGDKQTKSNWEKTKALGYNIAIKAFKALEKAQKLKDPKIALWAKNLKLPIENKKFHLAYLLKLMNRKAYDFDPKKPFKEGNFPKIMTEISVIKIGPATIFTMPGELDPQVLVGGYDGSYSYGRPLIKPNNPNPPDLKKAPKGPYLKELIPGKFKLFAGLAHDEIGYIVAPWNFQLHPQSPYMKQPPGDHYEETNSLGPKTLPLLLKAYDELLKYVKSHPAGKP